MAMVSYSFVTGKVMGSSCGNNLFVKKRYKNDPRKMGSFMHWCCPFFFVMSYLDCCQIMLTLPKQSNLLGIGPMDLEQNDYCIFILDKIQVYWFVIQINHPK